jgi:CubicO group peptidase (beta-lactamase class C family)
MKTIIKNMIVVITLILASGCIKEISLNIPYKGFSPFQLGDGWVISDPDSENMDRKILENVFIDLFNDKKYPTVRSLIIARNGKLVAEAYCKNLDDCYLPHNTMSVTKSITSILTGIALDKGLIDSLNIPIYTYLSPYFDNIVEKREITIRQVLTMETGLAFDNDQDAGELFSLHGSSLNFILHKSLLFKPGTDWYYGNGNPQLISGIIREVSGYSESEFAEKYLFEPLGINNYVWESLNDGLTYGAQGLWLVPRDMLKIGQLMANNGKWSGTSIVSEDWAVSSTSRQSAHQNYGFYWYPMENRAFYAEGHGGQLIWVYPEKNVVIVITSDPYTKSWILSAPYTDLFSGIISSLRD